MIPKQHLLTTASPPHAPDGLYIWHDSHAPRGLPPAQSPSLSQSELLPSALAQRRSSFCTSNQPWTQFTSLRAQRMWTWTALLRSVRRWSRTWPYYGWRMGWRCRAARRLMSSLTAKLACYPQWGKTLTAAHAWQSSTTVFLRSPVLM